jgi:hypothetical protein
VAESFRISGIDGRNGLDGLAADLAREAAVDPDEARKVVQKGLLNIKTDWRKRWSGIAHAPMIPYTINYDSYVKGSVVGGEVGPDDAKTVGGGPHRTPGNLAVFLEFGGPRNAPIPGGAPALEAERPRFERAMENLAFRDPTWR